MSAREAGGPLFTPADVLHATTLMRAVIANDGNLIANLARESDRGVCVALAAGAGSSLATFEKADPDVIVGYLEDSVTGLARALMEDE